MKTTHLSYKLIILITQLLLLGGCNGLSSNSPLSPLKDLDKGEEKCLAAVKVGIEKYRETIKGDLGATSVTWQSLESKIKPGALPATKINECKDVADNPKVKPVFQAIQELAEVNALVTDLSKEISAKAKEEVIKQKEDKIKEKIDSIVESAPTDNTNTSPVETLPRKFIKYTNVKLQALTDSLKDIPNSSDLQNKELQKQVKDLYEKVQRLESNQNEKIQRLESNQNMMMPVVFLLLPLVGVAGYFLGRGAKLSNPLANSRSKESDVDPSAKDARWSPKQDSRSKPQITAPKGKTTLGDSGDRKPPSPRDHNPRGYRQELGRQGKAGEPTRNFRLNDKSQSPANDLGWSNEPMDANQPPSVDLYQNPEPLDIQPSFGRNPAPARLTYGVATQYYNDADYDLLKPLSKGYYDATTDSVMRNREFWENPLELVNDANGLFWIVETVEPYWLLLPNPSKRIAKTRLPGFEYFFETSSFKGENYRTCEVVSAAYMNYVGGKWVRLQKGELYFGY